jgi:hypothetical protein
MGKFVCKFDGSDDWIIGLIKIVFMLIVVFDIIEMKLDFKIECKINRYVEKEGIYIIMRE